MILREAIIRQRGVKSYIEVIASLTTQQPIGGPRFDGKCLRNIPKLKQEMVQTYLNIVNCQMSHKKCRGITKKLVVQFILFCSLYNLVRSVQFKIRTVHIVQSVNCRDVGRDPPRGGLNCPTTTITDIAHCLSIILNHPPLITIYSCLQYF